MLLSHFRWQTHVVELFPLINKYRYCVISTGKRWISYFIPHVTGHVITFPCWNKEQTSLLCYLHWQTNVLIESFPLTNKCRYCVISPDTQINVVIPLFPLADFHWQKIVNTLFPLAARYLYCNISTGKHISLLCHFFWQTHFFAELFPLTNKCHYCIITTDKQMSLYSAIATAMTNKCYCAIITAYYHCHDKRMPLLRNYHCHDQTNVVIAQLPLPLTNKCRYCATTTYTAVTTAMIKQMPLLRYYHCHDQTNDVIALLPLPRSNKCLYCATTTAAIK